MSCLIEQFSNGMLVYQSTNTKKKKNVKCFHMDKSHQLNSSINSSMVVRSLEIKNDFF